jgi:hypothetical protein
MSVTARRRSRRNATGPAGRRKPARRDDALVLRLVGLIAELRAEIGELRQRVDAFDPRPEQPPVGWLTAKQVAFLLHCSTQAVQQRCARGSLLARMIHGVWWIAPPDAKPFNAKVQPRPAPVQCSPHDKPVQPVPTQAGGASHGSGSRRKSRARALVP